MRDVRIHTPCRHREGKEIMTTPEEHLGPDPQTDYTPSAAVQADSTQSASMAEQAMPASAAGVDLTQTMSTQAMPQIPSQQFPQSADAVYQAGKNMLLASQGFMLIMADDVSKTASVTSRGDDASYVVQVMENPQGGSVVQFVPQGQPVANMQMESMIFFGELNRELMMRQMNAAAPQTPVSQQTWVPQTADNDGAAHAPKKAPGWVLYISIGALVVAIAALVLLIVLTPKTGVWLVWVLGLVSLAFSGFSLYAALAWGKNMIVRILSGVAAVVSVLALVLGFVNVPKAASTAAAAKPSTASSTSAQPNATSNPSQDATAGTSDDNASESSDNGSQDQQQPDGNGQQPTDANSLEGVLAAIDADEKNAVENINAKEAEAAGKLGETYESYVSNKQVLTDWYATVEKESGIFYGKLSANVTKYFQMLSQQVQADPDMNWDAVTDDFYDSVYNTALDNFYDDIYDTTLDDVYDKYYDDVLDEKPDNVEYESYYAERSECYKAWSNARSDFYKAWSNMRSNVYKLWSEVRSTLWKDKYDFSADIERFQKKCAPYTAQ